MALRPAILLGSWIFLRLKRGTVWKRIHSWILDLRLVEVVNSWNRKFFPLLRGLASYA